MIQRQKPVNEKVDYMRIVRPYVAGERLAMSGDNIFESLATSNPEAFDTAKLEAILESKDIVNDFNKYLSTIISGDFDRFQAFLKEYEGKNSKEDNAKFNNEYYKDFNIMNVGVFRSDIEYLSKLFENGEEFMKVLFSTYLPDGLDEKGVKRLIRVRLANDKLLTDALMKMLEVNYDLFNINSCEAQGLLKNLGNNNTKGQAISDVRELFKDPKVLENFKDDRGNYDFRPIGGAYLIMRDKLEWQGAAPAKYLQNLFKYDCIVYSHGSYSQFERSRKVLDTVLNPNSFILKNVYALLDHLEKDENYNKYATDKLKKQTSYTLDEVDNLAGELFLPLDKLDYVYDLLKKLFETMIDIAHSTNDPELADWMYAYCSLIDSYMQPISDKHNIIRNKIDGRSSEWTIQPVNTLTQKNVTHAIDLLRALKKEGFKNILLMSCNPGSVLLPMDIRCTPFFKVTMGTHSVLIEALTDGNDYKNMDYLNEGLMDTIKYTLRSITKTMGDFFSKCRTRFNEITKNISKQFDTKFKNKKFEKTKVSVLSYEGRKPTYKEIDVKTADEFKKVITTSNASIMAQIQNISDEQNRYMNLVNMKYKLNDSDSLSESTLMDNREEVLVEFFDMNKKPPEDFYEDSNKLLNCFADALGKFATMNPTDGKSDVSKKIKDNEEFKNSLKDAAKVIDTAKKSNRRDKNDFIMRLDISKMALDISPNTVMSDTFSTIFDVGFIPMRPNKSKFKDVFQYKYYHKPLSDRSIMIVLFSLQYRYDAYGYAVGYSNVALECINIENNARNLKDLNILENASKKYIESINII